MRKRGVLFGSKKGISPLIATVLLIAFAVAMGALIMNWSSNIGQAEGVPDCSGINIILSPTICYSNNLIRVALKNEGPVVSELSLNITDDVANNKVNLKNSRLRRGDSFKVDIPYLKAGNTYVSVTPSVDVDGKNIPCDSPALEITSLEACQT